MDNHETFKITYSSAEHEEVDRIRQKYLPSEETALERLKKLDAAVERRATVPAVTVGVLGTLLFGVGMSLAMSEFGLLLGRLAMPVGIVCGLCGAAVLACAYPLYHRVLRREREKAAPDILRLTDELMK